MPPAHRLGDLRTCGATTVVVGQDSVTVNGVLWAVEGDINTHGNGQLDPSTDGSVSIHGIPVVVHTPTSAAPDALCVPLGGAHCFPETAEGSDNVSGY